jgi:hypothetical protein
MLPFRRRLFTRLLLLLLVFLLAWQTTTPVFADVAPPDQPSGVNPEPGEEVTQVRMLAETVILEVLADYAPESLGQARVSADFTMRNLGAAPETMPVRFPISSPVARSDGSYPEIHDLHISVNGQAVAHRRITRKDSYYGLYDLPWAEFDVSFPPGDDVNILVTYLLDAEGWVPCSVTYSYVLSTGAGWKGTIGSAEIVLRYPYEASYLNTIIAPYSIGTPTQTSGNEMRWRFKDLEPTPDDDIRFEIVAPSLWKQVLSAQQRVQERPADGEAWGLLGKAYKESLCSDISSGYKQIREDLGASEVYDLSQQAYARCVELLPGDALWHAGFAELLTGNWFLYNDDIDLYRAMEQVALALKLDPKNELALEIARYMDAFEHHGWVIEEPDGSFIFKYPEVPPTKPPESEPAPPEAATKAGVTTPTRAIKPDPTTELAEPDPTTTLVEPAPITTDDDTGIKPLCGAAGLALLGLALFCGRNMARKTDGDR